jgi:hypothetical protein
MNGTHQILALADDVNLLGDNIDTEEWCLLGCYAVWLL